MVIISDVHLGTYGCHARELLQYLRSVKPEVLVLNGDFIDMWQFRKHYFPKEHMMVLQQVLKMAAKGVKVYYITGNHDDALRSYSDFSSGNLFLRDKLVLQLKGKRYWIFHGDVFDASIRYSPWVAKLGGKGYDYLIILNRLINNLRDLMGKPRMSFAKKIKASVKKAVKFITDFETTAIQLAAEQAYDYVICGHIHQPQMRAEQINQQKVVYMNSGDWVESLTALEYHWNSWTIYTYDESHYPLPAADKSIPEDLQQREEEEFFESLQTKIMRNEVEMDDR